MVRLSPTAAKFVDGAAERQRRSRTQVIEDVCEVVAQAFEDVEPGGEGFDPFDALNVMGRSVVVQLIERGYASPILLMAWEADAERRRLEIEERRDD